MKRSHGTHSYPATKGVPKAVTKQLNTVQKKVVKRVQQKRTRRLLKTTAPSDYCQLCGLNPRLPENKGRQIYECDRCERLVCSDCSEDGATPNEVICKPCDLALKEAKRDKCSRCDAAISAERAARFSLCETCDLATT